MTRADISDEMLVAFADGEADAATAEHVANAIVQDAALAARLEAFVVTRQRLKAQFGAIDREAVPDALTRFVMSGGAVPVLQAANAPQARPAPRRGGWAALPLAACLAAVVAGGLGYWAGLAGPPAAPGEGAAALLAAADPTLNRALDTAVDGATLSWAAGPRGGEIAMRQSYRTRAGLCRSFGLGGGATAKEGLAGVACRQPEGWRLQVVAAEPRDGGTFRPASGGGPLDAFLDGAEAGEPLDAAGVQEQIAKGWR